MRVATLAAINYCVEKYTPEKKLELFSFLPGDIAQKLEHMKEDTSTQSDLSLPLITKLHRVHYTWYIPLLEQYSEEDQLLVMSLLSDFQRKKLCGIFDLDEPDISLSNLSKNFIAKTVFTSLKSDQKEFIPREFLPFSPLNVLLTLSKSKLVEIIDYLGLHDLSHEVKMILQVDTLKKIEESLSKEKLQYLKTLLKKKEPIAFKKMNLDAWNGNKEMLLKVIHQRGLNRLAKALYGSHPSMRWNLLHILDVGRARLLQKLCSDLKNDKAKHVLFEQITELVRDL